MKAEIITKEDVLQVANELGYLPTDSQIQNVIDLYPSEQELDPTGTWNLVVEQCLNSVGVVSIHQTSIEKFMRNKAYKQHSDWEDVPMWMIDAFNEFLQKTEGKTELVDKVLERIKLDVACHDMTAIDEMLKFLPIDVLTNYLAED